MANDWDDRRTFLSWSFTLGPEDNSDAGVGQRAGRIISARPATLHEKKIL